MREFMLSIYNELPPRYNILSRLSRECFVELMRRLMSIRFRMKRLPKRIRLDTNEGRKFVGWRIISIADRLLTEILENVRVVGYKPKLILKRIHRVS